MEISNKNPLLPFFPQPTKISANEYAIGVPTEQPKYEFSKDAFWTLDMANDCILALYKLLPHLNKNDSQEIDEHQKFISVKEFVQTIDAEKKEHQNGLLKIEKNSISGIKME